MQIERRRNHQEGTLDAAVGALTVIFLLVVVPVLVPALV
jgi:hypothetical protein